MSKFRKKPIVIEATQWFKNGDHPKDREMVQVETFQVEGGEPFQGEGKVVRYFRHAQVFGEPFQGEGKVVRYFRHPQVLGASACRGSIPCEFTMHEHGWIDTPEGGHVVCPGDWIITGIKGETYPCKPDIFEATYEAV